MYERVLACRVLVEVLVVSGWVHDGGLPSLLQVSGQLN